MLFAEWRVRVRDPDDFPGQDVERLINELDKIDPGSLAHQVRNGLRGEETATWIGVELDIAE